MDLNKFFQSKKFIIITWNIAGLIVILLVFRFGVAVGYKKATFSYRWGENYHLNFGSPRKDFLFFSDGKDDFISSYGAAGQIIKNDGDVLIVKDQSNVEKSILIKNGTAILRGREKIKPSDLKVNDFIVVIGEPNNAGQVEAKLIRIMPSPPPMEMNDSPKFFIKRQSFHKPNL